MAEVFVAERGQLTNPSKSALRKAGVVVVEVEDVSKARFWRSASLLTGDDLLVAALRGLNVHAQYQTGEKQRDEFVAALHNLMEARHAA